MARKLFTREQFRDAGRTDEALDCDVAAKRCVRVAHGVYAPGHAPPTRLELAIGRTMSTGRSARGLEAGVLLGLDGLPLKLPTTKRLRGPLIAGGSVVAHGVACTNGLQTIVDLAAILDDAHWEMANESALHKKLFRLPQLQALVPTLSTSRASGVARIRRVLAVRPPGAPPTESALETAMVQLIRLMPDIPVPTRQYWLYDEFDQFVARIDLCWPELGLFLELDGEGHKGQPVYDAIRQSAIVAATGWLCDRVTWTEVWDFPNHTARRLARIAAQARRLTHVS